MRRPGTIFVPVAVLLALVCLCFARLFALPSGLIVDGGRPSIDFANHGDPRPLGNDAVFVYLPHHQYVAKALATFGHLPAWDSSGFGGRPLIGNPQAGLFYPPVWIAWLSPFPSTLGWLTVAHLFWGGLGMYLMARAQGLGWWPATVAAGIYEASPYLLAQTFEGHYPHVWAASWFPWAFWAQAEHRAGRVRGLLALPLILTMAYLTGHPQEWFLLVLALSVWVLADALRHLLPSHGRRHNAASVAFRWFAVLAVALSLSAIELVPARSVLSWVLQSQQPDVPRNYRLYLVNLLQLLSPTALGGPADFAGVDNYWEAVLSFGLIPLVLVGVACTAASRRPRVRGWALLVLISVWFAGGRQFGLFPLLYRTLPGLAWFRVPARSLFLTSLGMAILAGFGLEVLRSRLVTVTRWRRFASRLLRAGLVVLSILFILRQAGLFAVTSSLEPEWHVRVFRASANRQQTTSLPPHRGSGGLRLGNLAAARIMKEPSFWVKTLLVGAVAATGCFCVSSRNRRRAADLLGLMALGELAWCGFALIQVTPAGSFFKPDPISQTLISKSQDASISQPPRIRARDNFYLDLHAVRYGIEKTNVNDVFQLRHAAALYEPLYAVARMRCVPRETPMAEVVSAYQRQVRQEIFDRMAVSALVSDRVETDPSWPVVARGTCGNKSYVIQRNRTALPRAYVVPRAEVVADDPGTVLSRFRSSDPHVAVLMTEDPLDAIPTESRQPFTPARWLSLDPDRPELEVSTTAPGLLVIADTWMPGWTATVDGRPTPVLRGNLAQRVLPLELPGHHRIKLKYDPPGLALGGTISVIAGLTWGLFTLVTIRKRILGASKPVFGDPQREIWAASPNSSRASVTFRDVV